MATWGEEHAVRASAPPWMESSRATRPGHGLRLETAGSCGVSGTDRHDIYGCYTGQNLLAAVASPQTGPIGGVALHVALEAAAALDHQFQAEWPVPIERIARDTANIRVKGLLFPRSVAVPTPMLAAVGVDTGEWRFVKVGDCEAWLLRGDDLSPVGREGHSRRGWTGRRRAANRPVASPRTPRWSATIDITRVPATPTDVVLVCIPGFVDRVGAGAVRAVLGEEGALRRVASRLRSLAGEAGYAAFALGRVVEERREPHAAAHAIAASDKRGGLIRLL